MYYFNCFFLKFRNFKVPKLFNNTVSDPEIRLSLNSVKLDGNACGEGARHWKEEVTLGFNGSFLTLRLLTLFIYIYIYIYIYGASTLDVSKSHTTTQHNR